MPTRLTTIAVASAAGIAALGVSLVGIPALAATATGSSPGDAVSERVTAIRDSLQGLVDDKTLTDAQADKVAERLGEKGGPLGGHDGFIKRGHGFGFFGGLDEAAKALGMSTEDVHTALRDGSTLADLAKQQGKDVAAVESALTASANARIDEAVKNGKLTQAQADQAKKKIAEGVKTFVNEGFPRGRLGKLGGPGFPHDGPFKDGGPRRDHGPLQEPSPSPSASASTSSFSA
jgi:hypothetical protein